MITPGEYQVRAWFRGAPDGIHIVEYAIGDRIPNPDQPLSEELARMALEENWIKPARRPRTAKLGDID